MAEAITNTSPLLYLYCIEALDWLPRLFTSIWTPNAVVAELQVGRQRGHKVPDPVGYDWFEIVNPRSIPSEWLTLDLGAGELAALALGLENPERIILLDDSQARRIAEYAGLTVWGTLRVLLEAKAQGLTERIDPLVSRLRDSGMWISEEIRQRILRLAREDNT